MKSPKVLVGCPTAEPYAYCLQEYARSVKNLAYGRYDVLIVDNSRSDDYKKQLEKAGLHTAKGPYLPDLRDRVAASRNIIRDHVINKGYDYFLSLEQDIIPPPNVIERLLSHHKPAVAGIYYKPIYVTYTHKGKTIKTIKKIMTPYWAVIPGLEKETHKLAFLSTENVAGNRFFQIRGAGLGCILIHRSVLERIRFWIAENKEEDKGSFDDINFSNDLWKLKIPMFVDTSVKCRHLVTKKEKTLFYGKT